MTPPRSKKQNERTKRIAKGAKKPEVVRDAISEVEVSRVAKYTTGHLGSAKAVHVSSLG